MSRRSEENLISDFRPYPHSVVPHPLLHPGGRSPIAAGRYVDGISDGDWNLILPTPIRKRRGGRVDIGARRGGRVDISAGRYVDNPISGGISAVPVPTPLFAGAIGLVLGILIGPALLASTQAGAKYLERQVRQKLS